MAEPTEADMIWNRACGDDPLRALPGDRALADLLYAHGLVMNGGVLHALECMTAEEISDADAGYRFFGLDGIASLLSRARKNLEAGDDLGRHGQQLDGEYAHLIPSESSLVDRFEARLKSNPSDFAALRAKDVGRQLDAMHQTLDETSVKSNRAALAMGSAVVFGSLGAAGAWWQDADGVLVFLAGVVCAILAFGSWYVRDLVPRV